MKVSKYNIGYQWYVLPTIKITYDKFLYGYRSIELIWWKWSFEFSLKK